MIRHQEFGLRLQRLLNERQWSQSDLVRQVFEVTGQKMGRDAISTYVNGRSLPSPKSLSLLSKALGVSPNELLPRYGAGAGIESFELRMAPGHPGKAWVKIERLLSFETAAKIALLINEDDTQEVPK